MPQLKNKEPMKPIKPSEGSLEKKFMPDVSHQETGAFLLQEGTKLVFWAACNGHQLESARIEMTGKWFRSRVHWDFLRNQGKLFPMDR